MLFQNKKIHILGFLIIMLLICSCDRTEKTFYEDGKLKSEIEKKGKRYHGKAIWYYSNGMKQHECNYVNDTLQGLSTRWYTNGKTNSVEHFKDNRLHGEVLNFDMNGKKLVESNYFNDTLHGPYKDLYTSGQTKAEGNYYKGLYDGQWIYYDADGTIVGMGEYDKGTGKQRAWYRNGELRRVIFYKENEKHGTETWYRPDGTIEKKLEYEHGELVNDIE